MATVEVVVVVVVVSLRYLHLKKNTDCLSTRYGAHCSKKLIADSKPTISDDVFYLSPGMLIKMKKILNSNF